MSSPAPTTRSASPQDGSPGEASVRVDGKGDAGRVVFEGAWVVRNALVLDCELEKLEAAGGHDATFDLSGIAKFDTTGAWLIDRTLHKLEAKGAKVTLQGASEDVQTLLDAVHKAQPKPRRQARPPSALIALLARAGSAMEDLWFWARDATGFIGMIIITLGRAIVKPSRARFTPLVHHMEAAGLDAVPIVMMMSFLIGGVLAYQASDQLALFGAQIFTVDLIGISVLREIGILLTAIMVAGRSGSAFTAQIGSMKIREEIDAMRTLGLDPMEMLVLPRILALVITLPMLGFLSDMAGLIGGGAVAVFSLDISPVMYIERLQMVVEPRHFWVGIIKAPVFAFFIAAIGCFEGMRVSGSAESVGQRTTQSVVEGIFVIIIADAFFSVLFANLGW